MFVLWTNKVIAACMHTTAADEQRVLMYPDHDLTWEDIAADTSIHTQNKT